MQIGIVKKEIFHSLNNLFLLKGLEKTGRSFNLFTDYIYTNFPQHVDIKAMRELLKFEGCLITDNLLDLHTIDVVPKCTRKIFYAIDPEWMRNSRLSNESMAILYKKDIQIYAPTESRARIYKKIFDKKIGVMPMWSLEDIVE